MARRNRTSGRSAEELREIAIRHLMEQTDFWGYVTREDAEAALDRIISRHERLGDEIAVEWSWDDYWERYGSQPMP